MKFISLFALSALGVAALESGAVPVKYPDCARSVKVNEVPGSAGYAFNEDCSAIYVLPALRGTLAVNGYKANRDLQQKCARLSEVEADSTDLQRLMRDSTKRLKALMDERAELEENLREGLTPVGKTPDQVRSRIKDLFNDADAERDKIRKWQKENDEDKLRVANEQGGQGRFVLESSTSSLLEAFKNANPKLRVLAMPIDLGYLSINETKPDDSDAAAMPAVRRITAIGVTKMPLLLDPFLIAQNKDLAPTVAPDGAKIFNGGMSGAIELSTTGGCAVAKATGSVNAFTMADVKDYIAATSSYAYQVRVKRSHNIVFRLHEFIRIVHEQSSRGGFFSSSTVNSMTDERRHDELFDFNVDSQDGRFEYTDAYVREVKKEFIDRALAKIIELKTGSPGALLALIDPGKNGAGVIGDELQKCPNLYCQIGAAGFKVLDAIFGSSSAVSSLTKTLDANITETVTGYKMVPVYGTTSFD